MQLAEIGHLGSYNDILDIPVRERNSLYENFVSVHEKQNREQQDALNNIGGE